MQKFTKAIIISLALICIVAIFDFFKYPNSFWLYSYALGAIVALAYYFFVKRDWSESLAIFISFFIMIWSGLEDLIFYLIRPIFQPEFSFGIPATLDHLYTHPIIGNISKAMGLTTVTPASLIISIFIGAIITYYVIKYLKEI